MGKSRTLLRSLEIRLLLPLTLTVGAILAAHAVLGFRATKAHFAQFIRAEVERTAELIMHATHDGMLLNRLDEVQRRLERIANAPEIASIRVYDKQGRIVLSAHPEEIGTPIPAESPVCTSCHDAGPPPHKVPPADHRIRTDDVAEHDHLQRLTVIENEPACTQAPCHYHPPDRRALGVLAVEMSMAPFDRAIGAAHTRLLWTTVVLILICGVIATLFVRRVVLEPVRKLHKGTRRVASGDLDTRIDVHGHHELAELGRAFNRMAADLRDARQQVTDWSRTLEQKVDAKTEELQQVQRQVLHMETMASLGKLSATVAHELNNPIGGILAYARLVKRELADQPLDDEVRAEIERCLTLMDSECTRCGAIVHNLLTFARRKGGAMQPVDLNEIVERALMLVGHHLQLNGIELDARTLDGDAIISADPDQIEQALLALLMNAIEAIQAAETDRRALAVWLVAGEDRVAVEIADSGVGIPHDVLPHIFEPFYSTKGDKSGVGLGLAVVYGIVNRHHGEIHVSSKPGEGTTFRIELPREHPRPDEAADQSREPSDGARAGSDGHGR